MVWTSSADEQIGTGISFTKSNLSAGTHTITLTATDSDDVSESDSVEITVTETTTDNTPPTASITSPGLVIGVQEYNKGNTVVFNGSGTDTEDGNLTGTSLVWISSIDGEIGTGSYFTLDSLSEGTHTITLIATDSHGSTGSDSVSIKINP